VWWCGDVDILLEVRGGGGGVRSGGGGGGGGDWWCGTVGIRLVVGDCRHIACGVGL